MAAGNTYTPIATTTLVATAASYTFSSIPSTYTDLELVFVGTDSASAVLGLQFNGDTATNYSHTQLNGDGTTATSTRASNGVTINFGATSTTQSVSKCSIFNYTNTNIYKTILGVGNASSNVVRAAAGTWRSTVAINSITVLGGTLQIGSTITLYGIRAA